MNPDACCHCLVTQSCPTVLQPHRLLLTRLLCPWDSPGKNTGGGWRALLHGIFLTQESNLSLLHWQGYLFFITEPPGKPSHEPTVGQNHLPHSLFYNKVLASSCNLLTTILGEGNDNPLQYSCLESSMNRGAWWATVHEVAQSWARLMQLSMYTSTLNVKPEWLSGYWWF